MIFFVSWVRKMKEKQHYVFIDLKKNAMESLY